MTKQLLRYSGVHTNLLHADPKQFGSRILTAYLCKRKTVQDIQHILVISSLQARALEKVKKNPKNDHGTIQDKCECERYFQ